MDLSQSLSALLAIIVIDLVLAGDNAIVIALAARSLPAHLQKRAIVWGAAGAIVVRSLMTVIVVWLLHIPGLMLAGGLLLVWIAYRLLVPEAEAGQSHGAAPTTFWGAMRTIVIADAVMGLDNVLAVAGAAHGSYLLVVLGLLISVPIVVWGSTVVLKLVDRFPAVVYVGAGVLVWTAVKMILGEPLLKPWLVAAPHSGLLLYLVIPILLWAGFVRNHRRLESRIHHRLDSLRSQLPAKAASLRPPHPSKQFPPSHRKAKETPPCSRSSFRSMARATACAPFATRSTNTGAITSWSCISSTSSRACRATSPASSAAGSARPTCTTAPTRRWRARSALVVQAQVPYQTHWATGDRAEEICRIAARLGVHHIVMGTARKNSITRMLEDSVTHRVLETTPVPVEVITGDAVSRWERWGLPAGVLGAGGLLLLAID